MSDALALDVVRVTRRVARLMQRVRELELAMARERRASIAKYLSMEDAAAYTGIKLETLRCYVHRDRLFTKYKHGTGRGRIVLSRAELDAHMERSRDTKGRVRLAVVSA